MALLLLPSIAIPKDRRKPYLLWTPVCVCLVYLLAVLCFGMVEMEWNSGQIAIPIMMTMFYFAGRNGKEVRMKP